MFFLLDDEEDEEDEDVGDDYISDIEDETEKLVEYDSEENEVSLFILYLIIIVMRQKIEDMLHLPTRTGPA